MTHSRQAKTNALFNNALSIFLARFFPSLASMLVVIYFSRYFGDKKEIYGAYQNFWIQLNVLYPIACFGIHVVLITYSPSVLLKLKEWLSLRIYLWYGLWVMLLSALFAALQYYSLHLHFVVPYLFMFAFGLSYIFESILIVFRNFKTLVVVNIVYAILFFYLHWQMLHSEWSFEQLFTYLLIICWARLVVYIIASFRSFKKHDDVGVDVSIDDIKKLWLHLGVYDNVQVLSNWVDKFLVSLLLTTGVSAIYFNGTQNIPFLPILLSAAGSAVLLQIGNTKNDDDVAQIIAVVNRSGKLLSCVMFPVFFFLLCFRYEVFHVIFKGFAESVPIFMISLFIIPVRAYSFTTVLQNRHKGAIINKGAIAELVLACGLMYPLYKLMGLPGLALSFIISTYLQALYYLAITAKVLQVPLFSLIPIRNWLIKLIIFAFMFIGIHYVLQDHFAELNSLILGTILCIACIVLSLIIEYKAQRTHG